MAAEIVGGGFEIVTLAVIELLLKSGSKVEEEIVAVLFTALPFGSAHAAFKSTVKLSVDTPDIDGLLHVIVPDWPATGVAQVHAAGAVMDWKVVFGGNWSVITRLLAGPWALFVTAIV